MLQNHLHNEHERLTLYVRQHAAFGFLGALLMTLQEHVPDECQRYHEEQVGVHEHKEYLPGYFRYTKNRQARIFWSRVRF